MNIIHSSIYMKSEPTETSLLETECLFGETVEILDESLDWVYCKLNTDNYCGWIKKKGLGKLKNPTHRVLVKRSFIYINKNPKSNSLFYLPMGAKILVENIKSNWAEISFDFNNKIQIGYVPTTHIVELNHKVKDWVKIAQLLEGTPYRWGGRDTIGLDCSALLQLSYQTNGETIPRNTSQQIQLKKKCIKDIDDLKRGCVVFWKGHVGIMIDKLNCIHANAFHMQTKIETLSQIINRIGKDLNITKMMDFN
jgi:hypothetical protein